MSLSLSVYLWLQYDYVIPVDHTSTWHHRLGVGQHVCLTMAGWDASSIPVISSDDANAVSVKSIHIPSTIIFVLLLFTLFPPLFLSYHLPSPSMGLIAKFMGPTWGPSGADRTQVGPTLAPINFVIWGASFTKRNELNQEHDIMARISNYIHIKNGFVILIIQTCPNFNDGLVTALLK